MKYVILSRSIAKFAKSLQKDFGKKVKGRKLSSKNRQPERTYAHVNVIRMDSLLNEEVRRVFSHIITVIYHNGFTEFIPTSGNCQESRCGHLYHSFSRNCLPRELFFVFSNGSSTDRLGNGTDITKALVKYEKEIISSINIQLPKEKVIKVKTGHRVNCSEIEYSVTFLLECFGSHGNSMRNQNIIFLMLSLMQEDINRHLNFTEHMRGKIELNAKEKAF